MGEPRQPDHRDVAAFDRRAAGYERGWRGQLHREISARTAALAAKAVRSPRRILDVGCGTGQLLRLLATTFTTVSELRGIDPAPSMIAVAVDNTDDPTLSSSRTRTVTSISSSPRPPSTTGRISAPGCSSTRVSSDPGESSARLVRGPASPLAPGMTF